MDGKTIYKKTVVTGSLDGVTSKNVPHGAGSITLVKLEGWGRSGSGADYPIPLLSASTGSSVIGVAINGSSIQFGISSTTSNITSSYITIYYVKNT